MYLAIQLHFELQYHYTGVGSPKTIESFEATWIPGRVGLKMNNNTSLFLTLDIQIPPENVFDVFLWGPNTFSGGVWMFLCSKFLYIRSVEQQSDEDFFYVSIILHRSQSGSK